MHRTASSIAPAGFRLAADLPPVVERELRVAARRISTYWSRVGAALAAIVIGFWSMAGPATTVLTPQAGRNTFRLLAAVSAFMLLGSIIRLTAEAFAREKREDTLGLLFLTPLKPHDLVFGKFVSAALGGFYRFVAVVPVLALPMLGGGVTFGDFALLVLALSNLAFFTAMLGLYISARCWDEKRAGSLATFTLVGLAGLPPLLGALSRLPAGAGQGLEWLYALSPASSVWLVITTNSASYPAFWCSVLLTHAGGWLFFMATCRLLPRCWQDKPRVAEPRWQEVRLRRAELAAEAPRSLPAPAQGASPPHAARKSVHRQFDAVQRAHLLGRNPILWFALRWRAETSSAWIVGAVSLVGFVSVGMMGNLAIFLTPEFALFVCYFLNAGLKTYVATQAGLALARDRAENSLELLLATPVTPRELVEGHVIALRGPLRNLIRSMLLIESSWLALTLALNAAPSAEERVLCAAIGIAMLAFLVADLYAVGWVALWEGVVAKDSRIAAGNAQVKVLFLPWLMVLGLTVLAGLFGGISPWLSLGVLVLGSSLADWWFMRAAKERLRTGLPELARRRAAGEVEIYDAWERLGRWLGRCWRKTFGRG